MDKFKALDSLHAHSYRWRACHSGGLNLPPGAALRRPHSREASISNPSSNEVIILPSTPESQVRGSSGSREGRSSSCYVIRMKGTTNGQQEGCTKK